MLAVEDIADVARLVVIDAETTGHRAPTAADVARMPKGMRVPGLIIQIGCVELLREGTGWATGRTWETLVNPDGPVKPDAMKVHGIHPPKLKSAPRFIEIRETLEAFLGDAPIVAHAARNEIDYLNHEMRRAKLVGWDESPYHEGRFLDTQVIGRDAFPGATQTLDSLLDRLWIDRSERFEHHGALLDAELTAEAFVKLATGFVQAEIRTFSAG